MQTTLYYIVEKREREMERDKNIHIVLLTILLNQNQLIQKLTKTK